MEIFLYILGAFIFLKTVIPGILGPVLVHSRLKHSVNPDFRICNFQDMPRKAAVFISQKSESFRKEGFDLINYISWSSQEEQSMYFALMVNRNTKDMGIAVFAISGRDKSLIQVQYIEYSTEFEDSTEIVTNNNPQPAVFHMFDKKIFRFPHIKNSHHLYVLHRKLLEQHTDMEPVLPSPGTETETVRQTIIKDFNRQKDAGYYYQKEDFFYPTWKGAVFMSWKLIWPVVAIRKIMLRRRANIFIRELLKTDTLPPEMEKDEIQENGADES